MKLEEIHKEIGRLLYIKDPKLIDLVLSVMISREQKNQKLWLVIIDNSGGGKSELIKILDDEGETTKYLSKITRNTLISGLRGKKRVDLAPKLKDKIILMPEMAVILSLHQVDRTAVFSQFRDLYDGIAGSSKGDGTDIVYKELNVSFIGCSTQAIDNHLLIHNSLGTREFIYRVKTEEKSEDRILDKILENSSLNKEEIRKEIKEKVKQFIKEHKYRDINITSETEENIRNISKIITKLRVVPSIDHNNGEVNDLIYPENPTRIYGQLIILYKALKSLDYEYSEFKALEILREIAFSSAKPLTIKILEHILKERNETEFKGRDISNIIGINPKKVMEILNILSNKEIGILSRRGEMLDATLDKYRYHYKINLRNELVKYLAPLYNMDLAIKIKMIKGEECKTEEKEEVLPTIKTEIIL